MNALDIKLGGSINSNDFENSIRANQDIRRSYTVLLGKQPNRYSEMALGVLYGRYLHNRQAVSIPT